MTHTLTPRKAKAARAVQADPVESAQAAQLRYVCDDRPGIRRRRAGAGFVYVDAEGKPVHDEPILARIKSLAIPPAWKDVWICPDPQGHLQAVGYDDRGRKQYRYHPRWREVRDQTKYDRMIAFAKALPAIRRRTRQDLAKPGLPREKVLAAVVQLLEKTLIRVGNDEYAKDNGHYGLTTLRDKHVEVDGAEIHFEFRGKSGVMREVDLEDQRLARIVQHCQDLPGYEIFAYIGDDGQVHDVTSGDVNDYLREISGQDFTAKDFRTWAGTVLAAKALQGLEAATTSAQTKKNVVRAVEAVAQRLGNTVAVCRKCYIHPAVLNGYVQGTLAEAMTREVEQRSGLKADEAAVAAFLKQQVQKTS